MNLRKSLLSSIVLLVVFMAGCTRIGPGHAGIVVKQAGSDRGVLGQTATTGWVWYNPVGETVIEYQTSMRGEKWTKDANEGKAVNEEITFTNKEQMVIAADMGISFSLDAGKLPVFYVKFLAQNEDDLDAKFTNGYLRNLVRNCMNDFAGKYETSQIMGDNAQFLKDSQGCVQADVIRYGVTIEQFGLLGAPRPPQQVIDSINLKAQAQQIALQKQMEIQQVQAEALKQIAAAEGQAKAQIASADGEAKANQLRNSSITPNILQLRALENQHDAIYKWDGVMPSTVLSGEGKNSSLLFNIPAGSSK